MLPFNEGWAGSAVWVSQPSIDTARSQVFFANGNLYSSPPEFDACLNRTETFTGLDPLQCLTGNVYQESILAINMGTGLINWVRQLNTEAAFTLASGTIGGLIPRNYTVCPGEPGIDADFGMAPTFVPGSASTPDGQDTVVIVRARRYAILVYSDKSFRQCGRINLGYRGR